MGIFDKAKDALSTHSDKVDTAIDKAGDMIDKKTGGKYAEHVDKGQALAKDRAAKHNQAGPTEPPTTNPV
ncbi:MAG TPA: antitoxin [Propionibacteriaceae bacterium]